MELSLNSSEHLGCGAYLLNLERRAYAPCKQLSKIFLTQKDNLGLKEELISLIRDATKVLKLCSFIITDENIFQEILDKAQQSEVAIFILTQLDQTKLTDSLSLYNFVTEDEIKESTAGTHLKYIKKLYDNGVHVRASVSAHAKFIISDRTCGFITSANFTTPSLTINTESGLYLDTKSSSELDKLFDIIFQRGTSYRQFLNTNKKHKMMIVQAESRVKKELLPNHSDSGLRYTYEMLEHSLYDEIVAVIDNAKEYIYLSTFSIVALDKLPELTNSIRLAVARGVNVYVFCRGMNYRHDHLTGSQELASCGAKIYADIYNHSKGIINESKGMIFTANIDGNHGLKNGFEVGYLLSEEQKLEFLDLHNYLIDTSHYTFTDKPLRIDFFNTYRDYQIKKGTRAPEFSQTITFLAESNLKDFQSAVTKYPLFYGKYKDEEFIIAGSSYYKTVHHNGIFKIISLVRPRFDLEKYCLIFSHLKIVLN